MSTLAVSSMLRATLPTTHSNTTGLTTLSQSNELQPSFSLLDSPTIPSPLILPRPIGLLLTHWLRYSPSSHYLLRHRHEHPPHSPHAYQLRLQQHNRILLTHHVNKGGGSTPYLTPGGHYSAPSTTMEQLVPNKFTRHIMCTFSFCILGHFGLKLKP